MPKKFRTRLAELREKQGVSRMDVIRGTGLAYTTIHSWENGVITRIDADTLFKVMELVGCDSIDDFLVFVEDDDAN